MIIDLRPLVVDPHLPACRCPSCRDLLRAAAAPPWNPLPPPLLLPLRRTAAPRDAARPTPPDSCG